MSGVLATTTVASCSTPSRTLCAASSGGLRPSLTAPAHNALASSDRNEETPRFNQTKKHHRQKPKPLLHSLTDTTCVLKERGESSMSKRPLRILVVEDEGLVAMVLEENLIQLGYDVAGPVNSTAKALALLKESSIDG